MPLIIAGGIVFAVVGALVLWREWKAYKFGVEHKDDPSTWSDEEPEAEAEEDSGEDSHEDQ